MLEYVTYAKTVSELPAGTRVAKTKGDDLLGTVTGSHFESVGVRWDNGGTSYGPASHGLWIVAEDEASGGQSAKTSMEDRTIMGTSDSLYAVATWPESLRTRTFTAESSALDYVGDTLKRADIKLVSLYAHNGDDWEKCADYSPSAPIL